MKVYNPDVTGDDWKTLIKRSHQTSLFVTPEWLAYCGDRVGVLAVNESRGSGIQAALVFQHTSENIPFILYQGLLLTRREQPGAVRALLEHVEQYYPGSVVINAPPLVDVRPFIWRWNEDRALWTVDNVKYTYITDARTKPFPDMPKSTGLKVSYPESREFVTVDTTPLDVIENLEIYVDQEDARVLWGRDYQGRGYAIAVNRDAAGLVWRLAQQEIAGAELYGVNSREMNKRKRVYGCRPRTYYAMKHHVV